MKTHERQIPDSQLVLNKDGSVYHLHLFPEQIADTIILVGDPNRVKMVSAFFDKIDVQVTNREIITHTGTYKGFPISVLSTGMGTDNIDIVLNELDALANIDLKKREQKGTHRKLQLIRLGTSGALQKDIAVGDSFIAGSYALGIDGLLYFYQGSEQHIAHDATNAFIAHMQWSKKLPCPYMVKGSDELLKKLAFDYQQGITATAPGFYAPQGRALRLKMAYPEMNKRIETFRYNEHKITNFEMESSALYGLSSMLGHEALTISVIIANRVSEEFVSDYRPYMEKLILQTLDRLSAKE